MNIRIVNIKLDKNKWIVFALLFTVHCSLFTSPARAQIGTWRNFLAYSDIQQIEAAGQELFVMASNGLYQYNKQDQSIYNYDKVNGLSDVTINHIRWCQQAKRLVVIYDNSNIDLVETDHTVTNISDIYHKSLTGGKTVHNVTVRNQYAYLATDYGVSKVDVKKAEITESYMLGFAVSAIAFDDTNIYVQSPAKGLWTCPLTKNLIDPANWTQTATAPSFDQDLTAYNEHIALVKTLQPIGPKTNLFGWLRYYKDKLWTAVGDYNTDAPIQVYAGDNQWQIYQSDGVSDVTGVSYQGPFCFDIDPLSSDDHVFAGTRNGLYEYRNGKFVAFYNSSNSPIEAYDGTNLEYELVTGVKFDTSGNLWILNSSAPSTSLIRYTNGTFTKLNEPVLMKLNNTSITRSNGELGKMMIDSKGKMWFTNNNWFLPALYQYDMQTDEITAYETFTNQDGVKVVLTYGVRCVTEDHDHNIWIGTDNGLLMLERSQIDQQGTVFTQVKVPRNDGTDLADYLLAGLDIRCITVDGAGRKWIGTSGNGVYLISTDNMEQLQHFTTENSPLLSDIVKAVAINPSSGEVFFGTEKGLCSFVSDATEAATEMTKDNVWAYPNPVTPDYTGPITITGLTMDADVKILAANGALIHQGRSNGGTYTWDGCDLEGRRVASGVYMVATATSSGEKGTVCKIAIVR